MIFFLPMIQEMLAYNKVNNEQTVEACDSYEKNWPEGKHIEDVLYMEGISIKRIEEIKLESKLIQIV